MTCERCGENVTAGRIVVRRTFAGFACYGCSEEVRRLAWEERNMAKKNGNKKGGPVAAKGKAEAAPAQKLVVGNASKPQEAKKEGSLAAIIDPMLLTGGHTTQEIAAELANAAGEAAKNRDLAANVRARMVSYTRKGWRVEKDDQKRVKVVQA